MKRIAIILTLTLLALAGCIPIGFKAQTQLITPYAAPPESPAAAKVGSETTYPMAR
jgi:hypothetical protein